MSKRNTATTRFIGAYIPAETKSKLKLLAKADKRPMSFLIEKILSEGVKHLSENQPKAA